MLLTLIGPSSTSSFSLPGRIDLFLFWKMAAPDLEAFSDCLTDLTGEKILSDLLVLSHFVTPDRVDRGAREWMSS